MKLIALALNAASIQRQDGRNSTHKRDREALISAWMINRLQHSAVRAGKRRQEHGQTKGR